MKVMVCHFVSDSHEVMTALIVVLPSIVVVEISLQLHRSYEMIDDRSKQGAWVLKQVKHPGQGWLMILLILQNAYCFGSVKIGIFCSKSTMWQLV
jgi:hypothetical protein